MITRIDTTRHYAVLAALVILSTLGTLGAVATAGAQTPPQWDAWIGCWRDAQAPSATAIPLVCVTPTATASAIQIATIEKGAVVARDTIDASGQRHTVNKQGCTGWESAQWSTDKRRVYVRSEVTCAGGIQRSATGILAISPGGEWLDVQGLTAGGNSGVRTMHYRDAAALPGTVPSDIASALAVNRQLASTAARTAAGASLLVSDIADAVTHVDTAVVQAWIVQRGAQFKLKASDVVALADAGVPGSVTDVMIGMAYPDHFSLEQRPAAPMNGEGVLSARDSARIASEYLNDRCFSGMDLLGYSRYTYDPCAFRYGSYGYNPYSTYGYRGYGSGYQPFGYYNSGFYTGPIVIVKGEETTHGKLVKGQGYTDGSTSGTRAASGSSSTSSSNTGSTGSASTSSSSSGSSSSSDGGRTAHARPPA